MSGTTREKEGEPGKTYHVHDIRWNQLPYMAQQRVGQLERGNFSLKARVFRSERYESASRGPSVPSVPLPSVEDCNLYGNSIVLTSKSVPP